jgi:hypothetical protein
MAEHILVGVDTDLLEDLDELTEPKPLVDRETRGAGAAPGIAPLPSIPILPVLVTVSGRYEVDRLISLPTPIPVPSPIPIPVPHLPAGSPQLPTVEEEGEGAAALIPHPLLLHETLFLDVDGRYPQNTASGDIQLRLTTSVHWIARLRRVTANQWHGSIWYKDGATASFPYTTVDIRVNNALSPATRTATATFRGPGVPSRTSTLRYRSRAFRTVDFEIDCAAGATPVLQIDTHAHPNRPPTLPAETLTVQKVFERAGFTVTTSSGGNIVPLSLAGANAKWSDTEMHDAMQVYWSKFANKAQWAMWVFIASLHEQGTSLGGIMFDDIGPNQRQGTAMFVDSFIKNAPPGDPSPAAWAARMKFWTTCHEMGHCFNLAHSWQKSLGTPWIPLVNEPEARSFMNYPYNVVGGTSAFFGDFQYRFSNAELLFMRHAPERFVEMGNALWFDHHGFQQAETSAEPGLALELRVNRPKPSFEHLEPCVVELKLTNISAEPKLVRDRILSDQANVTLIVKKDGQPARQLTPYASYCYKPHTLVLMPGESVYESAYVSSDRKGWLISEPGNYTVQALVRIAEEDIVSVPLRVRVEPARGFDQELIAQDYFSDQVGRVMAFDGSNVLEDGNKVLHDVVERLPGSKVALHARVALACALAGTSKVLEVGNGKATARASGEAKPKIRVVKPSPDKARELFDAALTKDSNVAAQSLGHIDFNYYLCKFAEWLASEGAKTEGAAVLDKGIETLTKRKVLDRVVKEVKDRRDALKKK